MDQHVDSRSTTILINRGSTGVLPRQQQQNTFVCAWCELINHFVVQTDSSIHVSGPETRWRGRSTELGTSLVPLLEGKSIVNRPPIHLLFSKDRGLRDGDWKVVSFQSQGWELYNVAADRCELKDLASEQPERLRENNLPCPVTTFWSGSRNL